MRNQSILVRVPATVGNLGGAHDQAALALDASLNLKATLKATGRLNIRYFGENGERVPRDRTNLIARAFESALHYRELEFTGVDFEVYSTIPVGFGLGSSAAAVWAGLISANLVYDLELDEQALLNLAGIFEQRPANLHAAWKGGLATCAKAGSGFDRTRVSQEFGIIAFVPSLASQKPFGTPLADSGESTGSYRLAAALAGYLSRPDSGKPALVQSGATEDASAVAEILEAAGCPTLVSFQCGGGAAVGFLTRGLAPDTSLSVQENIIRCGHARKVWNFKPSNAGAQEWNDMAITAPAPIEVGQESEFVRAAHATA
ncbi:MAG TPA: hypothetical protein VMX16_13560 [Terriglobia bacterium]|nr:hypothetical protein [Terriglobia bacterium]